MISRLRFLFCLTMCLAVLFAPFLVGVSLDGKAYAMGSLGKKPGNDGSLSNPGAISNPAPTVQNPPPVNHAPEPATLLLFGAGAVGLAAFRKKFKKK